ncbi:envelope-like protein, partial [Trifolium medium]|nr:envelope-like protein [Trifolium medium]
MSNTTESSPVKDQSTVTPSKARSTCSKSKEGSVIIANAVPITTMHASDSKKKSTKSKSVVKKEKSTKVSESSSSMSIKSSRSSSKKKNPQSTVRKPLTMTDLYLKENNFQPSNVASDVDTSVKDSKISDVEASETVVVETKTLESKKPSFTKTLNLENPKSTENLGQTVLNVADTTTTVAKADVVGSDAVISPTKNIVDFILSSLKKTSPEPDVVPDIGTSLAQPETVPDSPDEESGYEYAAGEEKSQEKVVTEEEVFGDGDEESQSAESDKTVPLNEEVNVSEKTVADDKEIMDVDDCDSIDQPLHETFGGSIAKRLRNRSGKVVPSASVPAKTTKKTTVIGPKKGWSKVVVPSEKNKKNLNRKSVPSSDSEYDVEQDVPDILPSAKKKTGGKKIPQNVVDAPLDNVSFHSLESAQRWKFVFNRRLAMERELGKEALECQEIVDLI